MSDDSNQTMIALMAEIQKDERAFALLTAKLFAEGRDRHMTYGDVLREFGDPRFWLEYNDA